MFHYNIWPPWKKDYSLEKSYFITKSPCIYHNTKTPSISDGVWRQEKKEKIPRNCSKGQNLFTGYF